MIKSTLLFVALVSLILLPKIGLIDYSVIPLGIVALIALIAILVRRRLSVPVPTEINIALMALLVLQVAALLSSMYHQKLITEDLLYKPVRQILILLMLSVCFSLWTISVRNIENVIITAAVVNGLIIFMQYILHNMGISPEFMLVPGFDPEVNAPFRKPGVIAGYPPAGLLGVYGSALLLDRLAKRGGSRADLLFFVICALSVILTSRMALLMLLVVMLGYGVYALFALKGLVLAGIGSIALIPVAAVMFDVVNQDTINVMFELFINYLEGRGFASESGTALAESYSQWPASLETFLLGNGLSAKSDYGYTVDSSAQIILFGGGIVPLIGYNLLLLFYFLVTLKYSKAPVLIVLLFLLDVISNLKGNTLFCRVIGDVLTLLFVSHVYFGYSLRRSRLSFSKFRQINKQFASRQGFNYKEVFG